MTIGDRIKKIRKSQGLTQKQLENKTGINQANIRKYESGRQNPKFETLEKIAKALGVSVLSLMDMDEFMDGTMIQEIQQNDDILPEEFNDFSRFIGKLGYHITLDDMQYYMVKDKKRVAISVDELKMLVRNSESVVKSLLESLMNKDT